jgi:hypothetical protein
MLERGSVDAVIGVLRALASVAAARADWRDVARKTAREIASASVVERVLSDLDLATQSAEGAELEDIVASVHLLVELRADGVFEKLEACDNRKMRRILIDALPRAGAGLLPLVRAKLRSPKWYVVRNAVGLIPRIGGTTGDLYPICRHPNEKVRLEIARTLRALPPDATTVEVAAAYLADATPEVRIHARGLVRGDLLSPATAPALEKIASDERQPELNKRIAIEALGACPHDEAAAALFRLLQPHGLIDLGAMRDLTAVVLRRSRAPSAARLFQEGLASPVWRVRKACERAASGGA